MEYQSLLQHGKCECTNTLPGKNFRLYLKQVKCMRLHTFILSIEKCTISQKEQENEDLVVSFRNIK